MPDLRGRIAKPLSRLAKTGALDADEIAAARALENAVLGAHAGWTGSVTAARSGPRSGAGGQAERLARTLDDQRFCEAWLAAMTGL